MADTALGAGDQDGLTVEPPGELGVELAHTLPLSDKVLHARAPREDVGLRAAHIAVIPPSTGRIAPLMKLVASLARKTIAAAISSGSAARPSGVRAVLV
jgi:hypothetical protein